MRAEQPLKAAKPAEAGPPAQTPSGTAPAEPASPSESPAKPADPGKPADAAKPAEPAGKDGLQEPGQKKEKKEKPGRKGKGGKKTRLPGVSAPSGAAAGQGAAGAAGAAVLGGLRGGGEKEKQKAAEEKTAPPPAAVETSSATESPAYSEGTGRKVAVLDFEGEEGAEFASLVAAALAPELRVYDRARLAALGYDPASVNRISARTVAADTGAEYLVTGKVSKKTATLTIISVYLRDGATGDIRQTESRSVRPPDTLQSAASDAAAKIKDAVDGM